MTPREAGKMLGKHHQTIIRWCQSGTMIAEQKKGPGGLVWDISLAEVQRVLKEMPERLAQAPPITTPTATNEISNIELDSDSNRSSMTRQEAERRIKVEDALKKQRENQLREKELVEVVVVEETVKVQYSSLLDAIMEVIDDWRLRDGWTHDEYRARSADIKIAVNHYERRLKHDLEVAAEA